MSNPKDIDHDDIDLVGLLAGELGRDETIVVGRHLRTCPACTEELVDLAIAHGALSAASGAVRLLDDTAVGPPAAVPSDLLAQGAGGTELPPLEVDTGESLRRSTRSRRLALIVTGVAAAALALAWLGTVVVRSGNSPSAPVVASAALQPIDAPSSAAGWIKAVAVGDARKLTVETKNLDAPSSQQYYEVWLLNPATQKMLPVGVLPPTGTGNYEMGASIMAGYSAVDVSLQANNGNPVHSTTSVMRATF